MTRPHRTLVVEDDPSTAKRFATIVEAMPELELLDAVPSLRAARRAFDRHEIDLLLTDLGLEDGSGVDLIGELRTKRPTAEIVVITVFGDERNVIRSIEAGASGYLLKGGDEASIQRAIRELLAGGSPVSPAIARHLLRRFRSEPVAAEPDAPPSSKPSPFSAREKEVLKLAAKGFTFPEIADLLGVSAHTVTTHMRRIYRKLEVSSKGEAIYEAVNLGLLSLDD